MYKAWNNIEFFKILSLSYSLFVNIYTCQAWWHTPIIPETLEAEAGGFKFKISLSNLVRP